MLQLTALLLVAHRHPLGDAIAQQQLMAGLRTQLDVDAILAAPARGLAERLALLALQRAAQTLCGRGELRRPLGRQAVAQFGHLQQA